MSKPSYRIYPSLLDAFQRYLDAEKDFESFFNEDGEGNYKRSLEEISGELEERLIDAVNRVDKGPIEAADKGTAFNELVDFLANGEEPREGLKIAHFDDYTTWGGETFTDVYKVDYNGFSFLFDGAFARMSAKPYEGAIPQLRVSAMLDTKYGTVELYGVIDEVIMDVVVDLKTTSMYEFGRYGKGWQRYVYPYCLVASGEVDGVEMFVYSVYKWNKGNPMTAVRYSEEYTYDHNVATFRLTNICERFIEWLEGRRELITDKKIFGE